jgi:hypothetical protein
MDDKSEYYKEELLKSMIFSYTIKKGRAKDKITFDSLNSTLSYQYYYHHKLPITMNPLNYGKLINQKDNVYIIQVNRTNIAIITQFDEFNEIKFYKEGDLVYEYKDHKINENTFIRSLANKKFTFKNNELVETQNTIILVILIFLIYIIFFVIFTETETKIAATLSSYNVIKLRKVKNIHV